MTNESNRRTAWSALSVQGERLKTTTLHALFQSDARRAEKYSLEAAGLGLVAC